MKLGLQLNSFGWAGGPERFGRNLAEIGFVPDVDAISPLETIGSEVVPAVRDL